MIYYVVSATITPGNGEKALAELRQLKAYFDDNYDALQIEITRTMDGPHRVLWVAKWESLASCEQALAKWPSDSKSKEYYKNTIGLFKNFERHFYEILS